MFGAGGSQKGEAMISSRPIFLIIKPYFVFIQIFIFILFKLCVFMCVPVSLHVYMSTEVGGV